MGNRCITMSDFDPPSFATSPRRASSQTENMQNHVSGNGFTLQMNGSTPMQSPTEMAYGELTTPLGDQLKPRSMCVGPDSTLYLLSGDGDHIDCVRQDHLARKAGRRGYIRPTSRTPAGRRNYQCHSPVRQQRPASIIHNFYPFKLQSQVSPRSSMDQATTPRQRHKSQFFPSLSPRSRVSLSAQSRSPNTAVPWVGSSRRYGGAVSMSTIHLNNIDSLSDFCDIVWADGSIFLSDTGRHCIQQVDIETGQCRIFVGSEHGQSGFLNGHGPTVLFHTPSSLAYSPDTKCLYVADSHNHCIREISILTRNVTTVITSLYRPWSVLYASDGTLYLTDEKMTDRGRQMRVHCYKNRQLLTLTGDNTRMRGSWLFDITEAKDGCVYMCDFRGNRVVCLSQDNPEGIQVDPEAGPRACGVTSSVHRPMRIVADPNVSRLYVLEADVPHAIGPVRMLNIGYTSRFIDSRLEIVEDYSIEMDTALPVELITLIGEFMCLRSS
eukprot:75289_1